VAPDSNKYFFHGDPLITSEVVVVGADPGTGGVHAFDRATGRQRWKYAAGKGVYGAIAGLGQLAYAIRGESELLALEIGSGSVRWSFPVDVWGWMGPAAAAGRVFVGSRDGSLYALSAETGRVEWRTNLGASISTSVTATPAGVFVGTGNGTMFRIDAERGTVLASIKVDEKLKPRSDPIVTTDALLVLLTDEGDDRRALVSVDLTLARVRWRQTAGKPWSTSRVFVSGDAAIVGTSAGDVVAYCTTDGAMSWSQHVTGSVRAVGGWENTLYVGTTDGDLYAVSVMRACPVP